MTQIGRNERCPCGSGKKFKHCCLLEQVKPSLESLTSRRLGRLADWVAGKFRSQIPAQADEFFFEFDAEEREILNSGKHAGANGVATLVTDFICIDAEFEFRGEKRSGLEWFLDIGGPIATEDRVFYEALSCSGLRAYKVLSVTHGLGMEVLDLFAPEMENAFVHEKLGSMQIAVGDVIGARLINSDGVLHIAAMVPFHAQDADHLLENYAEDLASLRAQAGLLGAGADESQVDFENEAAIDAAIARITLEHNSGGESDLDLAESDLAKLDLEGLADAAASAEAADADIFGDDASDGEDDGYDEDGDESDHEDGTKYEFSDNEEDEDLESSDDDAFDLAEVGELVEEMILEDLVAARVVSTYWLESVLSSLLPASDDSSLDE